MISSGSNEAIAPLIVMGITGDSYVSWAVENSGVRDIRLQRLDLLGNPLWGPSGILVRDNISSSEVYLYDMITDVSGAAVLAFSVESDNGLDMFAYRISPDGNMLWGSDGILLSDSTITGSDADFASIAATASGDFTLPGRSTMQRVL